MKPSEVKAAIEVIKQHLDDEWIDEGCQTDQAFGCASCQAVRLKSDLDAVSSWLETETEAVQ